MDCPTAGSGCMELPTCPWDTFVYEPNDPDQIGGFVTSQPGEIAVCFSPFNMSSIGLAPFDNFNADEMDRLGCTGQYVITPWTNIDVWGVCMLSFGDDSSSCALSAPEMCSTHTNVLPLGNSTPPCCSNPTTMCDPYGQCDQALGRTAAWPDFNDNGMMNPATVYIDNIHTACGDNSSGSLGAYAWSFDDGNQVLGLSDALKSCNDQSANYTITFCADGSNM